MNPLSPVVQKEQEELLASLLETASYTRFGQNHRFKKITGYTDFSERVPIQNYKQIKASVEQLKEGAENLFWPGGVQKFAVSAGTSGEGKHLPLADERLKSDRRFMRKVILSYFKQRPNIFRLLGGQISMPGSLDKQDGLLIGEISGYSALHEPAWLQWLQVADPQKLTNLSFQEKFDLLLENALEADLRVITAVPSWTLTLFQQVLEKTGKESIEEIWPNLNLLVCGGVKLANYKPYLEQLAGGLSLDFIETYGASEGYIGYSDKLERDDLKMVTDNGVFFECLPNPSPNITDSHAREALPLWKVQKGVHYGLLLSTNAGLWRYKLNDIIEFTSLDPLRFVVKGRVSDVLDEYGEALYIYEAEEALQSFADAQGFEVSNFSIAPMLRDKQEIPYHHWYIQLNAGVSEDQLEVLATHIDTHLQEINRHYAIRRETNALGKPQISTINQSDINRWKKEQGNDSAQSKLPRILDKNMKI